MTGDIEQENRIQLVLSIWDLSDDYNQYAGVAITSILENTGASVTIHLLYDKNLNSDKEQWKTNLEKYAKIEERYKTKIEYHHINAPYDLKKLPALRHFTFGALLRLFILDVFPTLNRILYLDCDTVVTCDIQSLWKLDLHGFPLAARQNIPNSDFQSGVILMDLEQMREKYPLTKLTIDFFKKHPKSKLIDQDVLNDIFQNNYLPLPLKYNNFANFDDADLIKDSITHYSWIKPWKIWRGCAADYEFWRYYAMTPWGEKHEDFIKALAQVSEYSLPMAKERAKSLLRKTWKFRLKYWITFTIELFQLQIKEVLT